MKLRQDAMLLAVAGMVAGSYADMFGSGTNQFELTFQNISSGSNPSSGYGQVGYSYGIGTFEITADQWQKYVNASGGPVGSGTGYEDPPTTTGSQAVNNASWYEAAQFVNWLNTSSGHQAAYSFDGSGNMSLWSAGEQSSTSAFRHKDAVYALPSENEWMKAAYWNGTSLQTYASPGDTEPVAGTDANFLGFGPVWNVGSGTEELNGTYDMMGNLMEWTESTLSLLDENANFTRAQRGGSIEYRVTALRSSDRYQGLPEREDGSYGFRVASVPEPSSLGLMAVVGGFGWLARRKFRR
ncbi:SUMF1/EgtB/PvdO family nonheme iron enzyme [Pontiella sp.]|uniref:SUMF1/EgtB/PvdO family nonheme iron enzyme n=1 Tax=Pontiella sp. TaxID=2837462 RepID=UPI003564FC6D